ncbi:MAG: hypothetical protein U0136_04805 [Bdellovibrionota bacterium]
MRCSKLILSFAIAGSVGMVSTADVRAENSKGSIETDPLAWLKNDLSCDQLVDQMKARYSPLGPFSEMPAATKAELRQALDVVCSPKYAHCAFSSCAKLAKLNQEKEQAAAKDAPQPALVVAKKGGAEVGDRPVGFEDPAQLDALADQRLNQLVTDRHRALERSIEQAAKAELAKKLEWERIQMADEQKLREREEARKHEVKFVNNESPREIISAPKDPVPPRNRTSASAKKRQESADEQEASVPDDNRIHFGSTPPPPRF